MGAIVSTLAFPNPPRNLSAVALRSEPGLLWLTPSTTTTTTAITSTARSAEQLRIPAVYISASSSNYSYRTNHNIRRQSQSNSHPTPQSQRPVILYSHGNAEDLGLILPYLHSLAERTQCDVLAYEYPGYGLSQGPSHASETLCYQAIQAAYDYLVQERRVRRIVAFGRSLGSGPTVHLCANVATNNNTSSTAPLVGCILQSPLTSAIRCVLDGCAANALYPLDIFCNAQKVHRLTCPVLILHGVQDTVVPCAHGQELHHLLSQRTPPPSLSFAASESSKKWHYPAVWVPGCGHNDMPEYYCLQHCRQFVDWIMTEQEGEAAVARHVMGASSSSALL